MSKDNEAFIAEARASLDLIGEGDWTPHDSFLVRALDLLAEGLAPTPANRDAEASEPEGWADPKSWGLQSDGFVRERYATESAATSWYDGARFDRIVHRPRTWTEYLKDQL